MFKVALIFYASFHSIIEKKQTKIKQRYKDSPYYSNRILIIMIFIANTSSLT